MEKNFERQNAMGVTSEDAPKAKEDIKVGIRKIMEDAGRPMAPRKVDDAPGLAEARQAVADAMKTSLVQDNVEVILGKESQKLRKIDAEPSSLRDNVATQQVPTKTGRFGSFLKKIWGRFSGEGRTQENVETLQVKLDAAKKELAEMQTHAERMDVMMKNAMDYRNPANQRDSDSMYAADGDMVTMQEKIKALEEQISQLK